MAEPAVAVAAESASPTLSIIIPTLNEAAGLVSLLDDLQALRHRGHEVIVVDGGSDDGTAECAIRLADQVLSGPRGRARQMNAGAEVATGAVLWFVHADSRVPAAADQYIVKALAMAHIRWGRFDVRLSGAQPVLRIVERLMNLRSRLTGIATGDQAVFVDRALFHAVGGYADIPLMEDIELCRRLKAQGRPACLRVPVITSSRRWEQHGVLRTIALMWGLRLAYTLGVDPTRLASLYR